MEQNFNTHIHIKIDWADLDLFGHVNNVAFFKYLQAARIHYCESIGLTAVNDQDKLSFMVASSHCQFKKTILYPDTIKVFAKVKWIKNTSFQLAYEIQNGRSELVALGEDVLVVFDHHSKNKVRMPRDLRNKISEIEGREM